MNISPSSSEITKKNLNVQKNLCPASKISKMIIKDKILFTHPNMGST
jgi:hypothetical protein